MRMNWLRENVQIGRVVTKGKNAKRFFLVLNVFGDKVVAMREDGQGATLAMPNIGRVYQKTYKLEERSLEEAFFDIHEGRNPALDEPKLSASKHDADDAVEILSARIDDLLPAKLSDDAKRRAFQLLWDAWEEAEFLEKNARDIDVLRSEIWLPFERRAKVLDHFGYLDYGAEKVTERGKWLADLRVDRPLLVGEALRHGLFDELEPKHAAALMAALAADSDRNFGELYLSDKILDRITAFEDIIYAVSGVEWKLGVEPSEEINLSAAAAAETWADGVSWDELVFRTKAEEGDLVRLLSRTGEALMQIAQLRSSNPAAAALASETVDIILREPIR
jgi:ATP-dependent RNA helicase HelY